MADSKFCKFCYDSGKKKELYTNHFVREEKGGTPCCPTLAATKCGYCKQLGHTPKHCARLRAREQRHRPTVAPPVRLGVPAVIAALQRMQPHELNEFVLQLIHHNILGRARRLSEQDDLFISPSEQLWLNAQIDAAADEAPAADEAAAPHNYVPLDKPDNDLPARVYLPYPGMTEDETRAFCAASLSD